MQVIDQINGSALFAQSAYSASVATKDNLGRDITATYLTGVDLSNFYTKDETSGKEELANAFANIPVGDPEVNAYVTSNSATINESTNLVQVNSSTWNDVTVYQSNSANYITAHQSLEGLMSASLLESADGKWTAYNSIPFKAGDEFPASADEAITTYQTNSGLYLTAHQDISNKLDVSAFSDVSGNFLTAVDLTPYYTTADANTLSSMLSGAIDYVSANAGGAFPISADEAITTYQTNSGTYLTAHQAISAEEWNSCYDDVNTNSGAWGGTPLPISARDGIDLEIDNGTLYIGASALTGCVPQSAFDELKASYDALSSLFATYSGQWLLPNEGV